MEKSEFVSAFRRCGTASRNYVSLFWILASICAALLPTCRAAAQTSPSGVIYIANSTDNTVSVISSVDQTFQLAIAVGHHPTGVATNSTYAYITNSGDNTVSVINTSNNTVVQTLTVGTNPVAVAANDSFAYVVNAPSPTTNGTVTVIDATKNIVTGTPITVGKNPSAVAIAPAPNGNVYVTNADDATVSVISNNIVTQTVALSFNGIPGVSPAGITVGDSLKGDQFAYVSDPGAAGIWVLDLPSSPSGTVNVDSFVLSGDGDTGVAGVAANDLSQTLLAANSAGNNNVSEFDYSSEVFSTQTALSDPIPIGDISLNGQTQPEQLAFTNDGANAVVTTPGSSPSQGAGLMSGFSSGSGNLGSISASLTTGNGPDGVSVTPNNPAVCAFTSIGVQGASNPIYSCSGVGACAPLPAQIIVPSSAQLNATLSCLSSSSSQGFVNSMALTFEAGSSCTSSGCPTCTISGGGNEGSQCTSEGNLIGGGTTFPASGVFTVQGTGQPGTPTAGSVLVQTLVGANCQLSASPTTVQTGTSVTGSVTCTAPSGDTLAGTINWGDGTTSTVSGIGNDVTAVPLTATHSYTSASPAGGYLVSATVTDQTEKASASVAPASVAVTVTTTAVAPTCTFSLTATTVQVGSDVSGSLSCSAAANDGLSGMVKWGDGTSSAVTATAVSGTTVLSFGPHAYSTAGGFTASATLTDTSTNLAATISPSSIQVSATTAAVAPSCTLAVTPLALTVGSSVSATLTCSTTNGDTLNATANWGDGTSSTSSTQASNSGTTVVNFASHTYTNTGTFTASATLTDATSGLAGAISPASIPVTVMSGINGTASQTTVPIAAGQSAMVNVTFTGGPPNVNFALSCEGLPQGATCAFSPKTLTFDSSGIGTVAVTISTAGSTALLAPPVNKRLFAPLYASVLSIFGLVFVSAENWRRTRRRNYRFLLCTVLIVLALLLLGCGSTVTRSNTVCTTCTPAGNYRITVLATSTSIQPELKATAVFTITVGP